MRVNACSEIQGDHGGKADLQESCNFMEDLFSSKGKDNTVDALGWLNQSQDRNLMENLWLGINRLNNGICHLLNAY